MYLVGINSNFLVVIDHDSLNSEPLSTLESRLKAVEKQLSLIQETAASDRACDCRDSNPGSWLGKPRSYH